MNYEGTWNKNNTKVSQTCFSTDFFKGEDEVTEFNSKFARHT